MTRQLTFRLATLILVSLCGASAVFASLSQKQARTAITKIAGMSLPSSAIRVTGVSSSSDSSGEAAAQLQLIFRVTRDEAGLWRLREIRTGEARWDDIDLIAAAANINQERDSCHLKDEYQKFHSESDLTPKRARCLVGSFFAVSFPSDAVRIKNISSMGLGSEPSALVVALLDANFKLTRDKSGWRVVELRTGNRGWVNVDSVPATLDSLRRAKTSEELTVIASALDAYRRERGAFVVSDKHPVLIDHLNPRYLRRVIRVDMWQRPLHYQGTQDHFTLRSFGPDGKENTPDDIVVSR